MMVRLMRKALMPPGFRFHPTDVELVMYYLKRKVLGKRLREVIAELDIYKYAPWDLPDKSLLRTRDLKWFFFCPTEKKYASGVRMNRATDFGYWKTTGKDRAVNYRSKVVGMIKTLVFHRGKSPKGERTDWVMYEYRLDIEELANRGVAQDVCVLCMIFKKDGPGPKNGAQYGAPFKEEEWDNEDEQEEEVNCGEAVSSAGLSTPTFLPINHNSSIVANTCVPEDNGKSVSCPFVDLQSAHEPLPVVSNNDATYPEAPQAAPDDDILAMLDMFFEDSGIPINENENIETVNNDGNVVDSSLDGIDIYNDLGDLGTLAGLEESRDNIPSCSTKRAIDQVFPQDDVNFLELRDLVVPLNCSTTTGGICADNNDYKNMEQLYDPADQCNAAEPFIRWNELPMLPEGTNVYGDYANVVDKEDNVHQEAKKQDAFCNGNIIHCEISEMGSGKTQQIVRRGEQRISYSRLQYLLESVTACSASAMEHPALLIGGSSIHVKPEVSLTVDGCTNDALSYKLEESLCVFFNGCSDLPKGGFYKGCTGFTWSTHFQWSWMVFFMYFFFI